MPVLDGPGDELGPRGLEQTIAQVEHLQLVDAPEGAGHGARTLLRKRVVVHVQYPAHTYVKSVIELTKLRHHSSAFVRHSTGS